MKVIRKTIHKIRQECWISYFFKDGGENLTSKLIKPPGTTWTREEIFDELCKSLSVPIYGKGDRS